MAKRGSSVRKRPETRRKAAKRKRATPRTDRKNDVAALRRELAGAREQQSITAEVLRLISRSKFDLQTILDTLTETARRLCEADMASISRQDATGFHHVTNRGFPADWIEYNKSIRLQPGRGSAIGRSLMERKIVQIADVLADPEYTYLEPQRKAGYRTFLAVPLLRDGSAIGVISVCRSRVKPFSEREVELVSSFADQAVIAIENVRLFDEVKARTEELHESLQQQTATADVLKLISRSAFDLPSVLTTLLESAARLCEADFGNVAGPSPDGWFQVEASYGTSPEFAAAVRRTPMRPGRASAMGRALEEKATVHILDAATDPDYELTATVGIDGFRTLLGVPLMREGTPIGVFAVGRRTVRAFTDKQIQLITTFADQAAIAIENARLFNETKEALERQTATAEILRVISSSPTDTQPVFDAIVQSGLRLFPDATIGIALPDENQVRSVAVAAPDPVDTEAWRRRFPVPLTRDYMHSVAILDANEVDIPDVIAAPPSMAAGAANFLGSGHRAVTIMPMLRGGEAIGALSVVRLAPGPLTGNQRAMLKTFADQAVIAIENTRTLNQLRQRTDDLSEALEQQTAIGDILRAISSSPGDVAPVFQTVVERAARICEATIVDIFTTENDSIRIAATFGDFGRPVQERIPLNRDSVMGRCICDKAPVQVADLLEGEHDFPVGRELARRFGHRAILAVPLLRDGQALGGILVRRTEARPFNETHVALLATFADQAAIAIENARLVNELRQRTDDLGESLLQQTATGEILASISASLTDAKPVFDTIVRNLLRLFGTRFAVVQLLKDGIVHMPAADGEPGFERLVERYPRPIDDGTAGNRAMLARQVVQFSPVLNNPDAPIATQEFARDFGFNSVVFAPMLRGDAVIGAIGVARREPKAFDAKQVALIQAFADQAVIAIENVRLFDEVQARTEELTEALQQQTSTAEVLQAISRSTFDLDTILQTLVKTAARLCNTGPAQIFRRDGDVYRYAASQVLEPAYREIEQRVEIHPGRGTLIGRMALEKRPVQILDAWTDPEYEQREAARVGNLRTMLAVPLMREGEPIGAFALARNHVEPFSDSQIKLVTTFADQAVIAIENVRLFDEVQARTEDLRESLQQQMATADVLKVISRSAFDLQLVLDTLVESATRLCGADLGWLFQREGDNFSFAASFGHVEQVHARIREYFVDRLVPLDRGSVTGRSALEARVVHVPDVLADAEYTWGRAQEIGGYRAALGVPLLREGTVIGVIFLAKAEASPYSSKQIELATTFADQAVIAIENVRLFEEVQARTEELNESLQQQTATAEVLKVISRSAFDLPRVLQTLLESAVKLAEADNGTIARQQDGVFYRAEAFGFSEEFLDAAKRLPIKPGRDSAASRALLEGRVVQITDILADPDYTFSQTVGSASFRTALGVPMLRDGKPIGILALTRSEVRPFTEKQIELVSTFADQAAIAIENSRLFEEVQSRTRELSRSLEDLRLAQDRLVQTEKLASLGQLTAGIAHEIKNPLNFVNNFSAMSAELIDELNDVLKTAELDGKTREEIDELTHMLKGNLERVVQHGKRADSIVKNMLLHSRHGTGEQQQADINAIVEESLNLAYHGARAERTGFNITLRRDLDPAAGKIELYPQEITRVFLNLISNGFYAATKRKESGGNGFEPILSASTRDLGDHVEIRIRDNGSGIPPELKEKIFNPFFTTKPAGEGTGLGLSMSHDIVVKQHGGRIDVDSKPGEFTEFVITLPRTAAQLPTGRTR